MSVANCATTQAIVTLRAVFTLVGNSTYDVHPRKQCVKSQKLFAMNTYAYPGCCTAMLPTIQRNSFPYSLATR